MDDGADQPGREPSKSQLDRLGERLRAGSRDQADLRALDAYRRSFRPAYEEVVASLRRELGIEGTRRPAKTTAAIIDKLQRQPIRLTQIQDIAGLRVVVDSINEQDRRVQEIRHTFANVSIDDRRLSPSHGYRAVHAIVVTRRRLVEIQIRTREQHLWAELSEKLSDVVDPALKYGGGPADSRETLLEYSRLMAEIEALEVADIHSARVLRQKEVVFDRLSANDPDREISVEVLALLRATQTEAEEGTRHVKKMLAELLTDYYNDLSHKP